MLKMILYFCTMTISLIQVFLFIGKMFFDQQIDAYIIDLLLYGQYLFLTGFLLKIISDKNTEYDALLKKYAYLIMAQQGIIKGNIHS